MNKIFYCTGETLLKSLIIVLGLLSSYVYVLCNNNSGYHGIILNL